MRHRLLAALGACTVCAVTPIAAQDANPLTLGVDITSTRVVREVATTQVLSGPVLGARASLRLRRVEIEGHYAEASLSTDAGGGPSSEDFINARVIARVHLLPWLALGAGPQLRAFVTPSGTARWTRIEVHGRVRSELINDLAYLVVDAWVAPATESNVQGGGTGARGGEAGILLRIPGTPTALHLSYFADRGTYGNGGGEYVEGVRAALVLDRIFQPATRPASLR